MNKNWKRNMID